MSKVKNTFDMFVFKCYNSIMNVVHCKKEPYDIFIGRGSKWGNPFIIGIDGTREEVCQKYRIWIKTQQHLLDSLYELEGKILGCYCDKKFVSKGLCHGCILIELINQSKFNMLGD